MTINMKRSSALNDIAALDISLRSKYPSLLGMSYSYDTQILTVEIEGSVDAEQLCIDADCSEVLETL